MQLSTIIVIVEFSEPREHRIGRVVDFASQEENVLLNDLSDDNICLEPSRISIWKPVVQ